MKQQFKYKFIKLDPINEHWSNVNASGQTCDAITLKGNSKNVAVISQAGKSVTVLKHGAYGRVDNQYPVIRGHKGNILDLEFVPYHDDYLATSAEDGTIKLWEIPEQFTQELTNPLLTLEGHQKKVNVISFNSASQGVLASVGLDRNVRVWDVQNGVQKYCIAGSQKDYSTDVKWKNSGDLIGTAWKDKFYRVFDPRQSAMVHEYKAHEGTKPSKFSWMGDTTQFITAGFSQAQQSREFKHWDLKKPDTPIQTYQIDKDMSVIYPYFDSSLDILYFTGKGDSMIRYFEFTGGKFEKYGNDQRCKVPGKCYSFIRNYNLDVERNEIARILQITNTSEIMQLSMSQPKRATGFSEDIYPLTPMKFGQSAADFFSGKNAEPQKFSMDPSAGVQKDFNQKLTFVQGEQVDIQPAQQQQQQQKQPEPVQQQQQPVQQQQQQQVQPQPVQTQPKPQVQPEPVQTQAQPEPVQQQQQQPEPVKQQQQPEPVQQQQQQQSQSSNVEVELREEIQKQANEINELKAENQRLREENTRLQQNQQQSNNNAEVAAQIEGQVGELRNLVNQMENN